MKFFIMTDLEGVVGTDSFSQTRTNDTGPNGKGPSMKQLAREVNACVRGILSAAPGATVEICDGHGSGGLFPEEIEHGTVLPRGSDFLANLSSYEGLFFVGQHAMAGTINAPLNHTYSSLSIAYYKLNDIFIGETGMLALIAGLKGVPTLFLAGDDKATLEATMFVPAIRTVATKFGQGLEKALHRPAEDVLCEIETTAAEAVHARQSIPPFTGIEAPYRLEIRYNEPLTQANRDTLAPHTMLDERTCLIVAEDIGGLRRRN